MRLTLIAQRSAGLAGLAAISPPAAVPHVMKYTHCDPAAV